MPSPRPSYCFIGVRLFEKPAKAALSRRGTHIVRIFVAMEPELARKANRSQLMRLEFAMSDRMAREVERAGLDCGDVSGNRRRRRFPNWRLQTEVALMAARLRNSGANL